MQLVPKVREVKFGYTADGKLKVLAAAEVPTSGWTSGQLAPRKYIVAPPDGIQDLDFYGEHPSGIVLEVISTLSAEITIPFDVADFWGPGKPLRGVRVHSEQNAIEADFTQNNDKVSVASGDPRPWPRVRTLGGDLPFPLSLGQADKVDVKQLVGHRLRIIHPGQPITQDYWPDRLNLAVTADGTSIISAYWG